MADLPSPTSGLFLEVSFRRLLASCEDIVAGTSLARPDLIGNWQQSPVFHHYVETLQEQLSDLETTAGSRVSRQLMQQYGEHVEALASRLRMPDVPPYCTMARQQAAPPPPQQQPASLTAAATGAAPGAAAPVAPRPAAAAPPVPVARTPPLPARPSAASRQPEPQPQLAATHGEPAAGGQGRLQTQQQLHEDLAEELAGLAAQLKSNTQAIEGRLQDRGQLLDSTETALDTSLQKTRESKERAAQIHKKGRANFCLTCLVMLIIGLLFAGMYVFIKMTRLAGYRATVPVPAPVPAASVPLPPPQDPPGADVPVYEQHYEL